LINIKPLYDRLWAEAQSHFAAGVVQVDQHLLRRSADRRMGITLVARPGAEVTTQVAALIRELRELEPYQYFYRADELHVTVLTLVSASEAFDIRRAPLAEYQSLFADLFRREPCISIRFNGVTASPGAILAQGYAEGDALNRLRDRLRQALARAGLAESLDSRYRISTAHATLMRFQTQPCDLHRLVAWLSATRERDFGRAVVEDIEFVANDWYMSRERVTTLATYSLQPHRVAGDLRCATYDQIEPL
jgi:2'-5' RNA ligase